MIIISHYKENLDYISEIDILKYPYIIYSRTESRYNHISVNKGHEAITYLKYIIENYDNLEEKNLFLHGHGNSYHQEFSSVEMIKNIKWNCDIKYFSVNRRSYYNIISSDQNIKEYNWLKENWKDLFNDNLNFPDSFGHYSCAQFVVHKDMILSNSIDFYKHCHSFILNTNLDNYITSRLFEYTWHYIFTKNNIEPKYEYKDFLSI